MPMLYLEYPVQRIQKKNIWVELFFELKDQAGIRQLDKIKSGWSFQISASREKQKEEIKMEKERICVCAPLPVIIDSNVYL